MKAIILTLLCCASQIISGNADEGNLIPISLKVEYLVNPKAVDNPNPRLSWLFASLDERAKNQSQTAYRIKVATSVDILETDKPDLWDTGKVVSNQNNHIKYNGTALKPGQRAYWTVNVWDENDQQSPSTSQYASWDNAFATDQWTAEWISAPSGTQQKALADVNEEIIKTHNGLKPVVYLRKTFSIDGEVKSAKVYATAQGVYNLYVNGENRLREILSAPLLSPGWTDYNKSIQYQAYDVELEEDNVIGVELGTGWFSGYVGRDQKHSYYGSEEAFLMELHVEYTDGTKSIITTDDSWKATTGPLIYSDMLQGELYYEDRELDGWKTASYDDKDWLLVVTKPIDKSIELIAERSPPVAVTGVITAIEKWESEPGVWVLDFGQNLVGYVEFRVSNLTEELTRIQLRHGEVINPNGSVYTLNLRSAIAIDTYVLNGNVPDTRILRPHFTFHGFRYIEVSGYPGEFNLADFSALVIGSDLTISNKVKTSSAKVNQLHSNIRWGQLGNFLSVPTDCPQRDERLGWLGDGQAFAYTAIYNGDVASFYSKYLRNVREAQSEEGAFSDVAPRLIDFEDASPAWGDAGIIIPYYMYRMYADVQIIEEHYEAMVKWIEYIYAANPNLIWTNKVNKNLGDWLQVNSDTPPVLVATAYFGYDALLMSKMAAVIGRKEDSARYSKLHSDIREVYVQEYISSDGKVKGDTQTGYLISLAFDLVPEELQSKVVDQLVANIKAKDYHLTTGFVGVGYLLPILTQYGQNDVAYKLLLQETYPSWLFPVNNNATTIWERWDGWTKENGFQTPNMNSFNHYALGSVGRWLFQYLAGIDTDEDEVGFKKIIIKPNPGDGLESVSAVYLSINGPIYAEWQKDESDVVVKAAASNFLFESVNEDIILFTYKRHCKQTLNVRVYESNWSNEFGLECAGTTGLVVCKDNERKKKYLFFLHTRLSAMCPRLTKIVTLLPSFLVTNNTNRPLRFMEHNEKSDLWIDLAPYQTIVFWPETSSMQMYVKYRDSKLISQTFYIANEHRTVLRMDKGGAISVEVSGGINDSFRISFNEYRIGDAPVLVKNYCADLFLKIQQQHLSPVTLLNPYHSLLYTWDDPTKPRQLVWNVYNNKGSGFSVDITKDGYGEEKIRFHSVTPTSSVVESSSSDDSDSSDSLQPNLNKKVHKDKIIIYWLCYREGLQRTLLLTQELRIYNNVLKTTFQERCHLECLVALSGVGLSIFTSENDSREHVYASIYETPAVWEVNVGQKWKTLTLELASWIEDKYRLHYKKCQLKEYVHIDFEKMFMLKPFFAELRRTYHPAVYFHFRKSLNYQYLNLRLQSFQVDNKQTGNIVLHPVPSQNIKELTPFAEVVISRISSKEFDIYRYIKFRLGSMYLNIENDLFVKLCELVAKTRKYCEDPPALYVAEIKNIHKSVTARPNVSETNMRTIIEYLTLTNFLVQLNISNKIHMSIGGNRLPMHTFLDYLFPFNMSPYMPLEGVQHKISSIEHVDLSEKIPNSISKLLDQVSSQFLQQYYSHVLGLQVLVNTFAIQPSIEVGQFESERMASILLYGSRCLLGHINMSPAAVEACVVDIFANQNLENIQRIRRHGSYHKSEIVPKTITISSRNFTAGVPNALGQLIVKNQNAGINCDGEMFFRTTGKALLSLITRHPDEKSDSVEVAREALRRASILGEPIKIHQRLTRYRNRHLGLTPISVHESMGYHMLETIGNSRFINDTYWAHAAIDKIGKSIIIVSLEHVIRINKCRLWGPWEVEWAVDLDDIISMPKINCVELILNLRQGESNTGGTAQIKIVGQKEMLVWLHEKIEQAIVVSMEDKSWTLTEN